MLTVRHLEDDVHLLPSGRLGTIKAAEAFNENTRPQKKPNNGRPTNGFSYRETDMFFTEEVQLQHLMNELTVGKAASGY